MLTLVAERRQEHVANGHHQIEVVSRHVTVIDARDAVH